MITFFVPGKPATQGSKRPFVHRSTGRAMLLDDNRESLHCWRSAIAAACREVWTEPPTDQGVTLKLLFRFARPKSHYGTGRNAKVLKESAPIFHTKKPDVDKLVRAVKDSLSGVLYRDDAQVFSLGADKVYDETPGVLVMATIQGE